ncbi:DUF5908 family protein [Salibacteraceae bacterium]|jgi:hypothetical protein|nr:DUF5908 family protein [Salibacteraceae bacterium]
MSIKVNEFVIQAKVNEGGGQSKARPSETAGLSASEKREIVDLVMERVKELLKRRKS